VAFAEAHWRESAVLGGKPVPVTVRVAPTTAAVGETVSDSEDVWACAAAMGERRRIRPARSAALARADLRTFELPPPLPLSFADGQA